MSYIPSKAEDSQVQMSIVEREKLLSADLRLKQSIIKQYLPIETGRVILEFFNQTLLVFVRIFFWAV